MSNGSERQSNVSGNQHGSGFVCFTCGALVAHGYQAQHDIFHRHLQGIAEVAAEAHGRASELAQTGHQR